MSKLFTLAFTLQCLSMSLLLAWNGNAQVKSIEEVPVHLALNEVKVEKAFKELERITDFNFVFAGRELRNSPLVNLESNGESLYDLLVSIASQTNLSFKQVNKTIHVKKSDQEILIEVVDFEVITISGTVTDESGEPIPGATILIQGTATGTATDIDGQFSLEVEEGAVLQISFIGYQTQQIEVGNQTEFAITLLEDQTSMEEVVVIGYGGAKKRDLTGAVAVGDLDTFLEVPVNNVMETLKGTIPGLNIGGVNQAGQVPGFSIRGQNSIGAGNAPLIVLDGVIYNGSLADILPSDIESFTVLKDASAAAIYGARSANGVILIQTKRGSKVEGKPVFNVNLNMGTISQLEPNATYSGEEYLQHVLDIRQAYGQPIDQPVYNYLEAIEQENYLATPDNRPTATDPWSYFLQPAYNNSANISFANSTERTNQFVSLGVRDQQGVVINDNFKQITARVNIESEFTDWLKININTSYAGTDDSGIQPLIYKANYLSPYASIFDENGNYVQFPQTTTSGPSAHWDIATDHSSIRHNLLGNIQTELTLAKGLVLTSLYSNNFRWSNNAIFYGSEGTHIGQQFRGQGSRSNATNHYQLFDNFLTFDRLFAEKHRINATLLYSTEKTVFNNHSLSGRDFENEVLGHYGLSNALIQTVSTGGGESSALGQMARVNYTFDEKYNLTGTVRRDGFSGFSRDRKWGVFSSVAASWNIIEESFLSNSGWISNLKLSASYGSVGNRAIGPYSTLARVGNGRTIFAGSNDFVVTQSINSFATNNLGWEKTTGLNLGLDFGFLQDRIFGRLDAYQTTTRDLIFNSAIPAISGGPSTIRDNVGEMGNKGIELTLNTLNISRPDFRWNSNFNFSLNRNKVISIFGPDENGVEEDLIASNIFIGRPLGEIFTIKQIGMWQQEDVENGTIMQGMRPGDYRGEDLPFVTTDASGNEIIEAPDGRLTSDKDRQFIGNSGSNFTWSLTNSVSYKNFSLMVYVYSLWGGNGWFQAPNAPYRNFGAQQTRVNTVKYDYWTPENTDAVFPRPDYMQNAAFRIDRYFDRSFIKLQKIALTYDFTQLVQPYNINGLRATLSADNLGWYAPDWIGLDPETGQGLQETARPSLRTILFSVALNF